MDRTPAGRYRLPVAPGHGQIRPPSLEASLPCRSPSQCDSLPGWNRTGWYRSITQSDNSPRGLRLIGGAAMQNAGGAGAVVLSEVPDLRHVSFTDIAKMNLVTLKKALGPTESSLPILPESRFSSSI